MLKYAFETIRKLLHKNVKQNSIRVGTVENGNIYQDSVVKIENPATTINHIKDNPEDLKITFDSISNVLLKENRALPQGYQVAVSMKDGKADLCSEPINEEARKKYPQRVKAKAKIDIPTGMSFQEALNRARISQRPINVEMLDMQKMIGDKIDPYQDRFQREWRSSTYRIVPEALPAGMKCVIGIENSPYQYNTVMRIQPVDPDAKIVKVSNKEYAEDFILTLTYHTDTEITDFSYEFTAKTWKNIYIFLNFMKAATPENRLYVHVTEQNQDLFSVKLDRVLLGDEYDSIDFNLDIAKRLVMIENQYGIQFPIDQALSNEDTELVWFLSDSIMGKPSGFTWENFNMTANFCLENPEGLDVDTCLEFKETASITILGKKIADLIIKVELEAVKIANIYEVKEAVRAHKTEQILISLIPGSRGNHGTRIVEI